MDTNSSGPLATSGVFSRRQVLGVVGAAAGAMALSANTEAASEPGGKTESVIKPVVRVAAAGYVQGFHDHRSLGVKLDGVREMTAKLAKDRPDFVCYSEGCACLAKGLEKGVETAPDLEPYLAEVGKIAREFDTAIIAPFLERFEGRVYNSVPIVDRHGKFVLVYRKNYPTIPEMKAGISPGHEVPVAECDGVRVGAAVCFDANFDNVAASLERQRARLVFWPSMFWGGQLLQHWALRYGFSIAVAYGMESALIDMNGRYLLKQGYDTFQVRMNRMLPWAVGDVVVNREVFHLDYNQDKLLAIREKYGIDVEVDVYQPEAFFLLSSRRPDLPIEAITAEFGLEPLRDYLARSVKMREERLA